MPAGGAASLAGGYTPLRPTTMRPEPAPPRARQLSCGPASSRATGPTYSRGVWRAGPRSATAPAGRPSSAPQPPPHRPGRAVVQLGRHARCVGAWGPMHGAAGVRRCRGQVEAADRGLGPAKARHRAEDEHLVELGGAPCDRPAHQVGVVRPRAPPGRPHVGLGPRLRSRAPAPRCGVVHGRRSARRLRRRVHRARAAPRCRRRRRLGPPEEGGCSTTRCRDRPAGGSGRLTACCPTSTNGFAGSRPPDELALALRQLVDAVRQVDRA